MKRAAPGATFKTIVFLLRLTLGVPGDKALGFSIGMTDPERGETSGTVKSERRIREAEKFGYLLKDPRTFHI
jgi:hypothetical protein